MGGRCIWVHHSSVVWLGSWGALTPWMHESLLFQVQPASNMNSQRFEWVWWHPILKSVTVVQRCTQNKMNLQKHLWSEYQASYDLIHCLFCALPGVYKLCALYKTRCKIVCFALLFISSWKIWSACARYSTRCYTVASSAFGAPSRQQEAGIVR